MIWQSYDTWTVVIGALSAASCALLGNYLVLRRMSMMGDAISHTVLPGLVLAFLIAGTRHIVPMFIGAMVLGVLTALLVQLVSSFGKMDEGASMGVVFTSLFALGLVMIRQAADKVDLDASCVLYGAIELAPFITVDAFGLELPRAAVTNGLMLLLNTAFIVLCYKELKVSSFDPALATSLGINARLMHYLLMTFVAATTIAAFESVGSILVIAMLIVPAATAHLLTDRLSHMLMISVALASLAAGLGHLSAITVPTWFGFRDTSTAGMMATVSGLLFFLAFLLAPHHGLLSRAATRALLSLRIAQEDVLALLYRCAESADHLRSMPTGELLSKLESPQLGRLAIRRLALRGTIRQAAGGWCLTQKGHDAAVELVRSHRLWETFLVSELGKEPDRVHRSAERLEHVTNPELQKQLFDAAGAPQQDPHAKAIPESTGLAKPK